MSQQQPQGQPRQSGPPPQSQQGQRPPNSQQGQPRPQQGPPPQYQGQQGPPPNEQRRQSLEGQTQPGQVSQNPQGQRPPQYQQDSAPNQQQQQGQPRQGPPQGQQGQRPPPNQERRQSQEDPGQGPPPNQERRQSLEGQPQDQAGHQQRLSQQSQSQPPQQPSPQPKVSAANPCCCDCNLHEGVAWIASTEFLWALITGIACLTSIIICRNAIGRLKNKTSEDEREDDDWRKFWDESWIMLIALSALHGAEIAASIILMAASSQRNRNLCFVWVVSTIALSLGLVGVLAYIQGPHSWIAIIIIPFRFYFIWIVWALAAEILVYPKGPPVRIVVRQQAGTGTTAVIVGSPVYSYGYSPGYYASPYYGGYYGGYGYPYYDPYYDVGLGVGLGLGMGYGYDYGYDYGYYGGDFGGGYYDSDF